MKNFKKRLFSMVIAVVLALGMMSGAAMTVSAEELKETVGTTTTSSVTVYTEQTDITYSEGATYTTDIMLRTSFSVASFQFSVDVPYFVEIKSVSAPEGLYIAETDYFTWSKTDSGFNVMFTSAEDRGGNFAIANVEYTVTETNASGSFSVGSNIEAIFTSTQNPEESIPVFFRFGYIYVTSGEDVVDVMKGDVNFDGVIDLNDLILVQKSIVDGKTYNFSEDQFSAADVNNDGSINVKDCQYVQMYLVGQLDSLEGIGGSVEEGDVYPMSLNVIDQNGNYLYQTEVTAEKGATYQEVFAPVFKMLETRYNIVDYTNIQSDYYGNVSVDGAAKLIVDASDIIYVNVYVEYGSSTENMINYVAYYKNGDEYVPVTGGSTYVDAEVSLYENVKGMANDYFGDCAELDGVYYDAEFKTPVTESDKTTSGVAVYIVLVNANITGRTYNLLDAEYTDGMQTITQVGTVIFEDTKATVTYGDEKFVAPYGNMLGQVSIYKNDYAAMCLTLEGSDAYIELNFDGSNKEVSEEFTAVAGEYPINMSGAPVEMTLTLYDNGVWKIGYAGIGMMGDYKISENGVVLYMNDDPQEYVYDAETNSFAPNYTSGGESDENVSGGMSYDYDISKVYGEYNEVEDITDIESLSINEKGFTIVFDDGQTYTGTEMCAMIETIPEDEMGAGVHGQLSLFVGDDLYYNVSVSVEYGDLYVLYSVDLSTLEYSEIYEAFAGDYDYYADGMSANISLKNNGLVEMSVGEYIQLATYTVDGNIVKLSYGQNFVVDKENGIIIWAEVPYGSYTYTDEDGVKYEISIYSSFYMTSSNGLEVNSTDMYCNEYGAVSLFINEYERYYIYINDDGTISYLDYVNYNSYETSEEFASISGTYTLNYDGMSALFVLHDNGVVTGYMGGLKDLSTYVINADGTITIDAMGTTTVDTENMLLIPVISDNTGSNENVSTGIAYGTYTYTDENGVEYWVDLYEDGSFYIKATDGTQASGNEVYAFSSEDLSLFVSDYECYHISIESDSKELSYFGHLDYSDREVTQEYAKYAGTYTVSVNGMEATFILHDNGVVVGYLYGAKDITVYVINDNGTITIDGMGSATIDVENKIITPIMSDEVVESDKVVVNSTVA